MNFIARDLFEVPSSAIVLIGEAKREAIEIVRLNHYTHSVPSGKSHCMRFRDAIVIWSIPANKNITKFLLGWRGSVWELSRLWAPDGHDRNLLSQAISAAIKRLIEIERPDAVVSYADPNAGHLGGVYRAASWIAHGQSEETRSYLGDDGKIVPRRAFHSGKRFLIKKDIETLGYTELRLPGKHRFVRLLSRKARKCGTGKMKRKKEKNPAKIFASAEEGYAIYLAEGIAALRQWQLQHPDWCNENDATKPVEDLVQRCAKLGRMPSAKAFLHKMPWTGRGTLREIHKLIEGDDDKLRLLLERDMINSRSTRKDIDNLRTAQKLATNGNDGPDKGPGSKEVAPRHRGEKT